MPKTPTDSRGVAISYDNSSYADFLFYLFYRSAGVFPELKTAVPLDGIAPLADDSFLPNDVATSEIENYAALYRIASTYDAHVEFTELLQQGEPRFAAFSSFWQSHILPKEARAIALWKWQQSEWFKTTEVPSLARVIGHEGTHMIVGPKAADWENGKNADQARQLMSAHGGSDYDIEEALCLLMQAKLSTLSGATAKDYLTSRDFIAATPWRTLLLALEHDGPSYVSSRNVNLADYSSAICSVTSRTSFLANQGIVDHTLE